MTEQVELTGMVILQAPAGEYDKRVVLLTKERGKITAFAKGAKKPKSHLAAATRLFVFGKFSLYEGKNAYNLVSAEIENYFEDITNHAENIYYGCYFLELADYFAVENAESGELLLLLYQSLRALMKENMDNRLIRRIVELRMFVIAGEYPDLFQCMKCSSQEGLDGFSITNHGILCQHCHAADKMQLEVSTVYTLQYVISTGIGKLFNFSVSESVLTEFGMVMNRWMAIYIERQFRSLEFIEE